MGGAFSPLAFSLTADDFTRTRYGQVVEVNLVRDKESGVSKGFAFLGYEQQKSTILAVDNFQGIRLAGSSLRIDHVLKYKSPQEIEAERERRRRERTKYADLISEELFESASGDLMMIPSGFGNLLSPSPSEHSPTDEVEVGEVAAAECRGATLDELTVHDGGDHESASARTSEEARIEKAKRKAERARIREERAKRRKGTSEGTGE